MTVSLSTAPLYPVPGRECLVSFSSSDYSADYIRLVCSFAPDGSEEAKRLASSTAEFVEVFEGSISDSWRFVPEVGGKYTFTAYEIDKGASQNGGSYQHDANGYNSEEDLGSNSVSLYVGTRLETRLGVSPDTSTLVLWVFNDTIRQTRVDSHGELSPAIVDHKTSRAESAASGSYISLLVRNLADTVASTAVGDIGASVDDLLDNFRAHIADSTIHYSADTDNDISPARLNPSSGEGIADAINAAAAKLALHMANNNGSGVGTETWHQVSGVGSADLAENMIAPLASKADARSRMVALADVWRVYFAHRTNSTIHAVSGSYHACANLPNIAAIHRYYLDALASDAPATPQGANPGATSLIFAGGFTDG